ncbi:MAG TPA: hypothetical protein VJX30_00540 [Terriglobales bacterium]|jgi:hypothetical protein|nr:hypothetical protein [Terriglobales bacterium]
MDPLITNAIDPALLRVLEKRGQERDPAARRRRPPVPEKPTEEEENKQEPDPDTPKHTLDDLA